MKRKFSVFVALILYLFFATSMVAMAMNTGFAVTAATEEETNTFLSNINMSLITTEPSKEAIECFDVNENNLIAIGRKCYLSKGQICIYSASGEFLYGYEFSESGNFAVEWDGDCINIYSVRGDCVFSVDANGQIVEYRKGLDTKGNTKYFRKLNSITNKVVDDTEYIFKKDLGFFNFLPLNNTQVIVKQADGNETLIYDANSKTLFSIILTSVIITIFVSSVIVRLVIYYTKIKRKDTSNS